ncbi:MAG: helix-turn-helix domain-containing protein, partial [Acidobacteriota bacterium]
IPLLVEHFAQLYMRENASPQRRFSLETLEVLKDLPWKGNVRELKNSVERVLILTDQEEIRPEDVQPVPAAIAAAPAQTSAEDGVPPSATSGNNRTLKNFKENAEREFLVRMLRENNWNITRTARFIDTPRSNLYKKIEQYSINRERDDA